MLKKLLAGLFQPELDKLRSELEAKMAAQAQEQQALLAQAQAELAQARQERDALQPLPAQLRGLEQERDQLLQQLKDQSQQQQQAQAQQASTVQAEADVLRDQLATETTARQQAEQRVQTLESEAASLQKHLQEKQHSIEALESEKTRLQLRTQMLQQEQAKAVAAQPVAQPEPVQDALIRPPARSRKKVLIVDDAATTRILQKNMLESAGYEVVMGNDGQQGQSLMSEHLPDLVITDIEMPRMNGFELTTWIKQSPYREVPVLMVTSYSDEAFQQKGLQAGANGFVEKKSFNQKTFLEIIQHYV
ncbi:MAG: response regulator [Candidatus Sericytochromatia bacterium]